MSHQFHEGTRRGGAAAKGARTALSARWCGVSIGFADMAVRAPREFGQLDKLSWMALTPNFGRASGQ
jgi:hypothetical protein